LKNKYNRANIKSHTSKAQDKQSRVLLPISINLKPPDANDPYSIDGDPFSLF